jgi:hypothetical protein
MTCSTAASSRCNLATAKSVSGAVTPPARYWGCRRAVGVTEVSDAELGHDRGAELVVGGDCTITLGVIAGFRRHHPDVGLVYADGDADFSRLDSGGSGIST